MLLGAHARNVAFLAKGWLPLDLLSVLGNCCWTWMKMVGKTDWRKVPRMGKKLPKVGSALDPGRQCPLPEDGDDLELTKHIDLVALSLTRDPLGIVRDYVDSLRETFLLVF
jgi:hypothetical protein